MIVRMGSILRSPLMRQPLQGTFFTAKRRRKAKDMRLAAGDIFSPAPGPVDGQGGGQPNPGTQVREDGKLVGVVIRQTQHNWLAIRTRTWGGTDLLTNSMERARVWLEGVSGGQVLRQHHIQLPGGALATEFWNDAYVAP